MTYRVYFNRLAEFPQVWSIDEGTIATEANVIAFVAVGCPVRSVVLAPAERDGLDPRLHPVAWLEVEAAQLHIEGGRAIFRCPTWAP